MFQQVKVTFVKAIVFLRDNLVKVLLDTAGEFQNHVTLMAIYLGVRQKESWGLALLPVNNSVLPEQFVSTKSQHVFKE